MSQNTNDPNDRQPDVMSVPDRESTERAVRQILARWANEASRDDTTTGRAIAGDRPCRGRDATIEALVDLVLGVSPREPDGRSWWTDTNGGES